MSEFTLTAPAKINLMLEVLGKRDDRYHEIRTILQSIDVNDVLAFEPAADLSLAVEGDKGLDLPVEDNLVLRAAELLRKRTGCTKGAHITLTKRISVAAGLGGGSSDAAAVLIGLRELWALSISDDEMSSLAAELGSDVPFFLRGGTTLASGRGEHIEPLPDVPQQRVVIAWPQGERPPDKTARMYAALGPEQCTDGSRTERLVARIRASELIVDQHIFNVFEAVLPEVDPQAAALFERAAGLGLGQPHLCGSGPAFFFLPEGDQPAEPLLAALRGLGLDAAETCTLPAARATAVEEL